MMINPVENDLLTFVPIQGPPPPLAADEMEKGAVKEPKVQSHRRQKKILVHLESVYIARARKKKRMELRGMAKAPHEAAAIERL